MKLNLKKLKNVLFNAEIYIQNYLKLCKFIFLYLILYTTLKSKLKQHVQHFPILQKYAKSYD